MKTKTQFETGADTHEINDLILFADNTRELCQVRDEIYNRAVKENREDPIFLIASGWMGEKNKDVRLQSAFTLAFHRLLYESIEAYAKEFPACHYTKESLTYSQKENFCELYAKDFANWKFEHGIK